MYVLGTAGHVDHGKSTLVRALTGIDPDRLREEKERGLTIDLGFAWLELPSGREVSIVDVPGHERFIKNMLAGAGGVDLALLVVAADEGVMPQTREHLAILDLLDVPAGVIALTKCDLVDDEYAALVEADLGDVLAGSRLAAAPIVRTSAQTREGLESLREAIDTALEATPAKRDLGRPRLPIDRAFTMQGFGAVVTGTLLDGALEVGQEIQLQPGGLRGRIRGLQRHRSKVQRLDPGTRAAVNLSGIKTEEIERGMVLALPGTLKPVRVLDVRLTAPAILSHPLAHDAGVTLLSATAESEAKLRLLEGDELGVGQSMWAQVVLETPIAVLPRDHCIVRTPNETAAGGVIVAVNARRHRRNDPAVIERLERMLAGTPEERLLDLLSAEPLEVGEVATRLGVEPAEARSVVRDAEASGVVVALRGMVASKAWLDGTVGKLIDATRQYVEANPLRSAAPREHMRSATRVDATLFDAIVAYASSMRAIEERGSGLASPGWQPRPTHAQEAEAGRFLAELRQGRYSPPTERVPADELLAYLAARGLIENTGRGVVFDRDAYIEMVEKVTEHLRGQEQITIAEVRDMFGTSRKYAQALLEHLDATKVTRRAGDAHVLRSGPEERR